jgi:alkaline phosphatase D
MKYFYIVLISVISLNAFAQGEQGYNDYNSRSELNPQFAPFYHGVASFDPLANSVLIWTRITVDNPGSVDVNWRVATDTLFNSIVASGTVTTDDAKDYTVVVDVTGLQPNTWYYYEFNNNGRYSLIGRTKTTPVGDVDSLRFAVVSCADYENGYYNAYKHIGERNDIDAVLHLGDYIYEYGAGGGVGGRDHEPANEIISLDDYRTRYSQYRLDPDLRYAHQQYPFITVWDDHEIANNTWNGGSDNHTPGTEGNWVDRVTAAHKAADEWNPKRLVDGNNLDKIYRTIRYGDLLNLYMLDTRFYARDEQGSGNEATRDLLGNEQMNWLTNQMDTTSVLWNILGQQVMVGPLTVFGVVVNNDQWDGYPADRDTLYQRIQDGGVENVVALTGDIHTSWGNDLPLNNYNNSDENAVVGSVGVEFVAPGITSSGSPLGVGVGIIQAANPHIRYADLSQHGYVLLDVNKTRTQGDWNFVNTITSQTYTSSVASSWYVNAGETFLREAQNPTVTPEDLYPQAPLLPNNPVSVGENDPVAALIGIYPNPFVDRIVLQFNLFKSEDVLIELYDNTGKTVYSKNLGKVRDGLSYFEIRDLNLSTGAYFLSMKVADKQLNKILVKTK